MRRLGWSYADLSIGANRAAGLWTCSRVLRSTVPAAVPIVWTRSQCNKYLLVRIAFPENRLLKVLG